MSGEATDYGGQNVLRVRLSGEGDCSGTRLRRPWCLAPCIELYNEKLVIAYPSVMFSE